MKFWDTSAIVPLLIGQEASPVLRAVVSNDPEMFVWWASEVECVSALARLEREGLLVAREIADGLARLHEMVESWHEIDPTDIVRKTAARYLRVHPLRASDSLQLAAASSAARQQQKALEFVTLDDRLALAARKEGFAVIDAATLA